MMKYKIGQILKTSKDQVLYKALSEEPEEIKKGTRIIIGPDKFAHYLRGMMIQPLGEDAVVEGYDVEGLAEFLYLWLRTHFNIDEMLESYDDTEKDFIECIAEALEEIGFYE